MELVVELWDGREGEVEAVGAPAPRPHCLEQLRDVDVTGRWVYFESTIEPIGDVALDHIDRVVGGGESGPDDVGAYEF